MKELIQKLEHLMIEKLLMMMYIEEKGLLIEYCEYTKNKMRSFEIVNAINEIKEGLEEADENLK